MNIFKKISDRTKLTTGKFQLITRTKEGPFIETPPYLWSPVPHLLVSNAPPSQKETILIHDAVNEVMSMENNNRYTHLEAEGTNTIQFVQQHRAIFSAIRRMPIEILQDIILWTVVGQPISEVKESRWRISSVSQAWREAALSLTILWTNLPTVRPCPDFKRAQRQIECFTEILWRSGNRPLIVTIEEEMARRDTSRSDIYSSTLSLLANHCERWQTVYISMPGATMGRLRGIRGRLPLLQILSLHIRIGQGYHFPTPLDMFEIAPLLRRVHISGSVPHHLKLPTTQFQHYKHLCITQGHLNQVVDYSSLESLMISQRLYHIFFPAGILPHLKKLEFVTDTPARDEVTLRCFDALKLPALEELTVVFPFYSPSVIPSITRMLRNTGQSRLRTLRITPGTMEPGQLTMLLNLTPALIALDTACPPHVDIENLASTEHKIVPRLQKCKFMFDLLVNAFLSPRKRDALNHLALSRCEVLPEAPMQLLVYSTAAQVHDVPWSRFKQHQLEDWVPSATATRLGKLNQSLSKLLLQSVEHNHGRRQSWLDKVMKIFDSIDNIEIHIPQDIYTSGLHFNLTHVCELEDKVDSNTEFIQRAKAILARWESLFLLHLGDIHWSFLGPHAVAYVPNDAVLRTSSNALDIIYGLKDEMSSDDACWPSHLATYGISLYWPYKMGSFDAVI